MLDVTSEAVIRCPVDVVATYAADPAHAPEWYANIRAVEWVTEPVVAAGSAARFEATFLGRTLRYTYEIVDHVPGHRLVMRTSEGPFPMETTYTWHAAGDGATAMTLRNRGQPSGFSRWVTPLMAPAVRRANRADLRRLREILEAP